MKKNNKILIPTFFFITFLLLVFMILVNVQDSEQLDYWEGEDRSISADLNLLTQVIWEQQYADDNWKKYKTFDDGEEFRIIAKGLCDPEIKSSITSIEIFSNNRLKFIYELSDKSFKVKYVQFVFKDEQCSSYFGDDTELGKLLLEKEEFKSPYEDAKRFFDPNRLKEGQQKMYENIQKALKEKQPE